MKQQKRYSVTMDDSLDRDFEEVASALNISRAEALRRAMMLFKHASRADHVILRDDSGEEREVLVK